jgi:hypothetical protein
MDIDHTVADAAWRDSLIGQWDAYYMSSIDDEPIYHVAELVDSLYGGGWSIIGCTARPEQWRKVTVEWLVKWNIPFDHLLMRPDDDFRKAPEVKVDMIKRHFGEDMSSIILMLDDRLDVVEAVRRELGIPAFQFFSKALGERPIWVE